MPNIIEKITLIKKLAAAENISIVKARQLLRANNWDFGKSQIAARTGK
jgi:hypothetical protein